MKLGFVSAILPEYSFEKLIDFAADAGAECVEACCWPVGKAERRYAGVTHIDVAKLNAKEIARIKDYLKEKKVSLSGLGYYPNPLDPDPANRRMYVSHIKKVISAAAALDVKVVNTFVGKDPSLSLSDNFKMFRKIWPGIIKHAEDKGVKVGIENCPMYFSKDEWPGGKNLASAPAIWDEMFSIIKSKNFGLNYDPSHMVLQQMDYISPLKDYKDKIFHFHIKDVQFYQDKYDKVGFLAHPLEYHSPKLPGLGDIDWGKMMSAVYDIRYKGDAVIEVEDRAFENSLKDRLYSIKLSLNYMRNFV